MNILATLFSGGVSKIVESVGTAIDKVVTSDQERGEIKIALEKVVRKVEKDQLSAIETYDKEITSRHSADMKSDSWLSKNVRPVVLMFMTVGVMGLAYSTIFLLDKEAVEMVEPWLDLFKVLLVTIYAFYFGSRGAEKVTSIVKGR